MVKSTQGRTPNEALRAHVTRVGFDLSLGHTHVAALVAIAESHRTKLDVTMHRFWVPAVRGCMERGLVIHHPQTALRNKRLFEGLGKLADWYSLTPAGELVVSLLTEAGLYNEYRSDLVIRRKSA